MKRFAWKLQRLLDIKKKEEQAKRAELLAVTEQLAQLRGNLLMQKSLLKSLIRDLAKESPRDRLSKQELFLKSSATSDERIKELKKKVNEFKEKQEEKIAELLEVNRYKEGLNKLREKAKTEFIEEQEKLEQKEADEMSTISFARKMTPQGKFESSVAK